MNNPNINNNKQVAQVYQQMIDLITQGLNEIQRKEAILYVQKAINLAEDCKKLTEKLQQQLSQSDPYMKQIIENLVDKKSGVTFDDIQGLENTKKILFESIILPNLRPDIFIGIRAPHKGILFHGPPGNGKTLLAKAVAQESKCTFLSLSAANIVQKYMGEGEKLMKALLKTANYFQPCIIFIDEIDSLLTSRSSSEHEASRRLKTEFLISFDGISSSDQDRIILIGATNRPGEIDDAALRRFTLKIFIDQPDELACLQIINKLLNGVQHKLTQDDIKKKIVSKLKGYSASDIKNVVKEACMEPVRNIISNQMILTVNNKDIQAVQLKDFENALKVVQPTLTPAQYQKYKDFDKQRDQYKN